MESEAYPYRVGDYVLINHLNAHPWPAKIIKISKDTSQPYRVSLLGDRACISLPQFSLLPFSSQIIAQLLSKLNDSQLDCKLRYAIELTQQHMEKSAKKKQKSTKKKNKVKLRRTNMICAILQVLNISKLHEKYIPSLPLIYDHDEGLQQSGELADQTDFKQLAAQKDYQLKIKVRKIAQRLNEQRNRRLQLEMEDIVTLDKDEESTMGWDERDREQLLKELEQDQSQTDKMSNQLDMSYAQLPDIEAIGSSSMDQEQLDLQQK